MRINEIANEIYSKSFEVYKKPIAVKIEGPIKEVINFSTLESKSQTARIGDYIVTGIKGEKYPISKEVFTEYIHSPEDGPNMYKKKKKLLKAYKVDFKGEVATAQGEVLNFRPGYYIVMETPEKMWAVEESIFDISYKRV